MIVTKVAKRYAAALFLHARENKVLDTVAENMQLIREYIKSSHELQMFLKSQVISREKKRKTLEVLFGSNIHNVTRQFLILVLNKRREKHLHGITDAFDELYKKDQGLMDIEVWVASTPEEDQIGSLQKALESRTGKKVRLSYTRDVNLKGGMAVRIGDTVIDGSIKHKLQRLETRFHQ